MREKFYYFIIIFILKQEFFLLLMKEILDPKYGMFDFYAESQVVWFKRMV